MLDRPAIELLLKILDAPTPVVSAEALALADPAASAALLAGGLLVPAGYDQVIAATDDHSDRPVSVRRSESGGGYGYFSPTSGWIDIEPHRLLRYQVDIRAMFLALMPAKVLLAPNNATTLLEGVLWNVGSIQTGRRRTEVWLARRLGDPQILSEVEELIRNHPARDRRILLTSTRSTRQIGFSVPDTTLVAIADVLDFGDEVRIDARVLEDRSKGESPRDQPLWLSSDGRELRIRTVTLTFRGKIQRDLIRLLVAAYQRGGRLAAADLLNEVGSAATSLPKAFGTKKWKILKTYLKHREGSWGFEV